MSRHANCEVVLGPIRDLPSPADRRWRHREETKRPTRTRVGVTKPTIAARVARRRH